MSWRYVDDQEHAEMLQRAPVVVPCDVGFADIVQGVYPIQRGGKLRRGEDLFDIDPGAYVKILDGPRDAVGCYEVEELTVRLPGGASGELKKGAWVALLPEDFREYMGTHDVDA